jgi:hypothetical protein
MRSLSSTAVSGDLEGEGVKAFLILFLEPPMVVFDWSEGKMSPAWRRADDALATRRRNLDCSRARVTFGALVIATILYRVYYLDNGTARSVAVRM